MLKESDNAGLRARIEKELNDTRNIVKRIESKITHGFHEIPDQFKAMKFAGYLHSFSYNLEDIFKLIARYVDQNEPRGTSRHKRLLHQMTIPIKGVRPPVISLALATQLKAYLSFRHFFDEGDSLHIDWNELKPKMKNLRPTFEQTEAAIQKFLTELMPANQDTV